MQSLLICSLKQSLFLVSSTQLPVSLLLRDALIVKYVPKVLSMYTNFYFPHSYCRMIFVTINSQTIRVGQFVWARCVIPFPDNK